MSNHERGYSTRILQVEGIGESTITEEVKIGFNKGQFLVRIPKAISNKLGLTTENRMTFVLQDGKLTLKVV